MSALGKILLYLAAVLLAGVFISPPAYWLCQWLLDQGMLELLRGFPFHRYFSRTLQVSAIVLLVPLFFSLRVRSLSALGLERDPRRIPNLLGGVASGLIPCAIFSVVVVYFGIYQLRTNPDATVLLRIAGTAVFVGIIEEFLFRGVLLGLCTKAMGNAAGLVVSSLVFAGIHFLRPAKLPDAGPVTWLSGWEQLLSFTHGVPPWPLLGYGLATLFVAGILLGLLTQRTSALWGAVGLHAAWIFSQQSLNLFAAFRPKPSDAWLPWIGESVVSGVVPTGIVPLGLLLAAGFLSWRWVRRA